MCIYFLYVAYIKMHAHGRAACVIHMYFICVHYTSIYSKLQEFFFMSFVHAW